MKKIMTIVIVSMIVLVTQIGWADTAVISSHNEALYLETVLSDEHYVSIAADNTQANVFLGAKADGGVDVAEGELDLFGQGEMTFTSVSSNTYIQVIPDANTPYYWYALRENGDIDAIYKNVSEVWVTEPNIVTGQGYTFLVEDSNNVNWLYGAKATGGLDVIYYQYSQWNYGEVLPSTSTYSEMVPDPVYAQVLYCLTDSGDLHYLYVTSMGQWDWYALVEGESYTHLCTYPDDEHYIILTKPGGAVDLTYWDTYQGWYTYEALPPTDTGESYVGIVNDAVMWSYAYALKPGGGMDIIYWNTGLWRRWEATEGGAWQTIEADKVNGDNLGMHVYVSRPRCEDWIAQGNTAYLGDISGQGGSSDCKVDLYDYSVLSSVWFSSGVEPCPSSSADISGPLGDPDCKVDGYDIDAMVADWLSCGEPNIPSTCTIGQQWDNYLN